MGSTKVYEKRSSQVMGKDSSNNPSPNGPRLILVNSQYLFDCVSAILSLWYLKSNCTSRKRKSQPLVLDVVNLSDEF